MWKPVAARLSIFVVTASLACGDRGPQSTQDASWPDVSIVVCKYPVPPTAETVPDWVRSIECAPSSARDDVTAQIVAARADPQIVAALLSLLAQWWTFDNNVQQINASFDDVLMLLGVVKVVALDDFFTPLHDSIWRPLANAQPDLETMEILDYAAVDALVCIGSQASRDATIQIAQTHPDVGVRNEASAELRVPTCGL